MLKVNREPMKDGEVTKFNFCLISILGRTLDSTVENAFEGSDRRQKVENWRLGEQLGGMMKAIVRGWKTQDWEIWM